MIRRAFTMRLKPGSLAEYCYHHDNIWPELVAEIERSGIASITTFQRDLDLFLVSEIADEAAWDKLWKSPVHQRWAEVMQPLMHLRDDGIVDAGELVEVFHITTYGQTNGQAPAQTAAGMFEPPTEPTLDERLRASDALWREPSVQAAVAAIEATVELMAMEEVAAEPSPTSAPPAAEPAGAPPAEVESVPAAKPARKIAVRPTKKRSVKKARGKKKPPAKKTKRKTAKRPKKRAAKKRRKKAAKSTPKKGAKKSKAKKVRKTARKKRAKKRG